MSLIRKLPYSYAKNFEIRIKQDYSSNNHAFYVWDSAVYLSQWLDKSGDFLCGKSVCELGSGTGLIGICCYLQGAKEVIMTDKKNGLNCMRENVKLNLGFDVEEQNKLKIQSYEWNNGDQEIEGGKFDVIICCDCVYENESMWKDLLSTLKKIGRKNPEVQILICSELRGEKDFGFYLEAKKWFDVEPLGNGCIDETYQCDEIKILMLRPNASLQKEKDTQINYST